MIAKISRLKPFLLILLACLLVFQVGCEERDSTKSDSRDKQEQVNCKTDDNLGDIADSFISRCRKASIRRKFPGQYLYSTLGSIKRDKTDDGKTAWKLLNDGRFKK